MSSDLHHALPQFLAWLIAVAATLVLFLLKGRRRWAGVGVAAIAWCGVWLARISSEPIVSFVATAAMAYLIWSQEEEILERRQCEIEEERIQMEREADESGEGRWWEAPPPKGVQPEDV